MSQEYNPELADQNVQEVYKLFLSGHAYSPDHPELSAEEWLAKNIYK